MVDDDVAKLDNPIDVMYLFHKAFMALSMRTENLAAQSVNGSALTVFREAFESWRQLFLYHVDTEDKYMTTPLLESQAARKNEDEHEELRQSTTDVRDILDKGDSAGLSKYVSEVMRVMDEEQHEELTWKMQEVEDYLRQAIGEDRVVARTRRHLYGLVMTLRILEFDHFENEEAFVVTEVRERMTVDQQMEVARHLLIDDKSKNPRWIIDWLVNELDSDDRKLLAELESRL